ncbi:MAG: molybdenum cofactor guanylyltransferase, partial [Deltaproteobacteria bacterium]|nr:molybdenum cofactor guanylyltransferase [Deltaproteobacteria bacterium]
MTDLSQYEAAILCGGQSRRMGRDKAFLRSRQGQLLIHILAEKLAPKFHEVHLITNDPLKFAPYPELAAYPILPDVHPGCGPSGAIRTALLAKPGRTFFITAGDQPALRPDIIEKLAELMIQTQADLVLPRFGHSIEPLHAFYGPGCEPALAETLKAGRLAIREIFPAIKTVYLELDEG